MLTSSGGALIPLSQVARIQFQTGEGIINREMNQRNITVKLNYRVRDPMSLVSEATKAIAEKVSFDPKKYRIEWGGQFEKQVRAEARFRLILGLVLGLMIALLYAEFGILRHVLLILGVVPLATLGGLIALHATGAALNVASGIGFIALFGIAVLNGVIMVANLNRVRDHGVSLVRGSISRRQRASTPGSHDGYGRYGRHAACSTSNRRRQRRTARCRDRRDRRAPLGHLPHPLHYSDDLFRHREMGSGSRPTRDIAKDFQPVINPGRSGSTAPSVSPDGRKGEMSLLG